MDYDTFQPCFYENETELSPVGSYPNEDMWKKFELLPTPPLSPQRDDQFDSTLDLENLTLPLTDYILNDDDDASLFEKMTFPESPPSPSLHSKLIQDCMWSGDSGRYKTGDKLSTSLDVNSSDCVDPAAVFPYPMHSITGYMSETKLHNLGTETPSDSEEEIDVVTVERQQQQVPAVSGKRKATLLIQSVKTGPSSELSSPAKTTVTVKVKVDRPLQQTEQPRRVECPTDVHNYCQPFKRVRSMPSSASSSPSHSKRFKRELSVPEFHKRVSQKLHSSHRIRSHYCSSNTSSRTSSDSEDSPEGKRSQHNDLERKRRNDLKFSFFALRDSIPDLMKQERAPKVLILKKASEHIRKLGHEEQRLVEDKEMLVQNTSSC
uniref:c-Myc n=1 Tax=Pinctada fucata TaxID=50426 RepID=S5RXA9_PINFU|nr:c-Myc [Pinctada fucata]